MASSSGNGKRSRDANSPILEHGLMFLDGGKLTGRILRHELLGPDEGNTDDATGTTRSSNTDQHAFRFCAFPTEIRPATVLHILEVWS